MKFIIVAPGYDDNSGGIVVLHQLCDRLNNVGQEAYLWPFFKPILDFTHPFKTAYLFFRYFRKNIKYGFKINSKLNTPIASYSDLKGAIIVYPEVIVGNPLKAHSVVRWLLHKPGFNNGGKIDFGINDLFFYYDKAFDDSRYNSHPNNHLHIMSQRFDIYKVINYGEREGSCYLLRKGYKRKISDDLTASQLVDGLSHEQTAKIFNQTKYCISYDTYTMYNVYAAMCGCIPIIIPEEGISKEQWQPNEESRYGMAYGFEDIAYAIETRPLMLQHIEKQECESNESVVRFIEKCKSYFNF
ncbi:MAG: hypothetical protein NTY39_11940 [Campylobacterales bacterium]|nr:hypothetical protein [Campylobacterales bacterium]